jgi:translocation and assembly module TamA
MRRDGRSVILLTLALLAGGCAHEPSEGRPWLHRIRFSGNEHFGAGELKERIALEETSWVPFRARRWFEPATLDADRDRIVAFYQAHGFFNARVVEARVVPRAGGASVDVELDIDEGPPTHITAIRFVGLEGLPQRLQDRLTHRLPLSVGEVFVHEKYLDVKALLETRLREATHAWAQVHGEALVDRERKEAEIELHVDPGPEVRFGELIVHGSPLVAELRRRAAFRPGEPFDPERLESTRGRLQATGLFSSVQLRAEPREGDPTIADVVADLAPARHNELRVGFGFGIDQERQQIYVPVQYSRQGFLGGLRQLRLRASAGYVAIPTFYRVDRSGPALTLDATFIQPDLGVRDLTLRSTVGFDLGVDYAFRYFGPRGAIGFDYSLWRNRIAFGASANFQFLRFFDVTSASVFQDPAEARRFLGYTNPYYLAYLLEQATLDLRDRPVAPRLGFYAALTLEQGVPISGSFSYQKYTPDVRAYLPLGSRVVLAGRLTSGWLTNQGSDASPITRRYYAGGADSHRGFNYDRLAPQVPAPNTGSAPIPIGGDLLFLAQGEVRVNLFRIGTNWVGMVGFCDAGDVPQRGDSIDFGQLHVAVGPGLRFQTPIGTLRTDLGIRLNRLSPFQPDGRQNPDPGQRFAFHISIGEAF